MTDAVVVGGSIAGMSAARVLADRCARVTLIERDAWPQTVAPRKGVPQARHVHALLVRGRRELEKIFPGFEATALRMGAMELDFGTDFIAMRPTGWEPRDASGLMTIWASRDLLEAAVRDRLQACARVQIVNGSVVGMHVTDGHIRGVTIRQGESTRTIEADLVVDAAGRGSKADEWLRAAGKTPPEETVVDAFVGYASLWMRAPSAEQRARWGGWRGLWIDGDPPRVSRGGVLFPIEDDRCIVTIAGFAKDYPPSDEPGFRAWLRTLRSPILAEVTEGCASLGPVHTSRSMTNRWRHYDRWRDPLDGFLSMGDAVCAFNPVYGQGMSTSAACAGILARTLEGHGTDARKLPRAFFRAQARFLAQPWAMATGADFLFPTTRGVRPFGAQLFHPYLKAVFETALENKAMRLHLGEVFNLIRPASALFDPRVGARAIAATARRSLRPHAPIPVQPPF